jgi:sulfopyruvate decarboxylase TPP-binding subunit
LHHRRAKREEHGYGAGKRLCTGNRVSGIKRHLVIDTQGLPRMIEVTNADAKDCNSAPLMLLLNNDLLPKIKNVLVDHTYSGESFKELGWQIFVARVGG